MTFLNRNNPETRDLAEHWKVLLVLVVAMIPELFAGYGEYAFILLLPLVFLFNLWTIKTYLVIGFSILYVVNMLDGGIPLTSSKMTFYLLFPVIMLQTGSYFGTTIRYSRNLIRILTLLILCLAVTAIQICVSDTIITGLLVNPMRNSMMGTDKALVATGYGMMLALLLGCTGLLFVPAENRSDKAIKTVLMIGGVFALFCTVHLINRTGLALMAISFIVGTALQPFNKRRILYLLIMIAVLGGLYWIFLSESELVSQAMKHYVEREHGQGTILTRSGRDDRMAYAIDILLRNPEGGVDGIIFYGRGTYAHNLWVDAGLKGGWLCMGMLVYFAVMMCVYVWKTWKYRRHLGFTNFDATMIVMICVTFMAQSMNEPVIDGQARFFWLMLFFWGMLSAYNKRLGNTL